MPSEKEFKRRKRLLIIISSALLVLVIGVGMFFLIGPSWYRGLRPEMQEIWCNRVSLMCDWKPTPPFTALPPIPTREGRPAPEDLLNEEFFLDTPEALPPGDEKPIATENPLPEMTADPES